MKRIKKVLALVTTLAMLLTMVAATGLTAFAADPADPPKGSIEITSPVTDPNAEKTTYEAYKIFDMTTNGELKDGKYTAVAYTINSAWTNFFAGEAPGAAYLVDSDSTGNLNQITVNGAKKYINITDSNVADFAKVAFKYAQEKPVAATTSIEVAKGAKTVKFENLDLGYYMVYPKGASVQDNGYTSIVSITNTEPNGKIIQKAKYPGLVKEADDLSVEVGQKVTYTLKSNVPDTTGYNKKYEMTFADKTTDGLTFDGVDSIVVKIGDDTLVKDTDYTVSTATADFSVTIDMLKGAENNKTAKYTYNAPITVTYTATVNEAAVTKIDENHATLEYNNDPKDSSKKDKTPPVEVPTYSSKLIINKIDAASTEENKIPLAGAKFVLRVKTPGTGKHEQDLKVGQYYFYDATAKDVKWVKPTSEKAEDLAKDTTITVVTTDAQGKANFDGLEDGVYELIEVEAPAGYNLLTTPVEVTINGKNATEADLSSLTVTQPVENNSGVQLPGTGGIGTTIFYILGSLLVVGCGIVLVSRKRMQNNK